MNIRKTILNLSWPLLPDKDTELIRPALLCLIKGKGAGESDNVEEVLKT